MARRAKGDLASQAATCKEQRGGAHHRAEQDLHLARRHFIDRLRQPAVGHVHEIESGHRFEQLSAEVRGRAGAGGRGGGGEADGDDGVAHGELLAVAEAGGGEALGCGERGVGCAGADDRRVLHGWRHGQSLRALRTD